MAQPRKRPPTAHRTQSRTTAGTGAPPQDAAPYREFFENANDALALFNPDGTIALVNRAAERLLGYTRAELLGQHYRKVVTKATGYQMFDSVPTGQPDYEQGAEIACRATALFAGLAKAAGKKLTTQNFATAAEKEGPIEIPGSGKVTYDKKTHTFEQPVYIYRYDPTTKASVRDPEPSA